MKALRVASLAIICLGILALPAAAATCPNGAPHCVTLSANQPAQAAGVTVSSVNIYRSTTAGGEGTTPFASTPGAATTYIDTAVTAGTTYFYQVTNVCATCSNPESPKSNEISATVPTAVGPPLPPNQVTVTAQ